MIKLLPPNTKWTWIDRLDRWFMLPFVERLFIRRLQTPAVGNETPVDTLYVDMSVIHRGDAGTGIQRVVRSVLAHLPGASPASLSIVPVIVRKRRQGYVTMDGEPLLGRPGAVFFGLDFATESIFRHRRTFAAFRRAGGRIWFLVHDTLPISHPQWFTPASCVKFRRWMRVCAALADGFLCVSQVVADELRDLLETRYGRQIVPPIGVISPGSEIASGEAASLEGALPRMKGLDAAVLGQAALVVGTLEPRKGHQSLLEAFEELWDGGTRIPLVLVGRPGWGTEALQDRIRSHRQNGRLLFWLDGVDDSGLRAAYTHCRMVVVPSFAEGYGLPLDEALAMGAPVLARDIPVFRRHVDGVVSYLPSAADRNETMRAIVEFHANASRTKVAPRLPTWPETAAQVLRYIVG